MTSTSWREVERARAERDEAYREIASLRAELAALRQERGWRPGWRHVKRGTEYQIIGSAMLQASTGLPGDGATLVLYKGEDGKIWARAIGEFHDGRFVPLPAPAQDGGENG